MSLVLLPVSFFNSLLLCLISDTCSASGPICRPPLTPNTQQEVKERDTWRAFPKVKTSQMILRRPSRNQHQHVKSFFAHQPPRAISASLHKSMLHFNPDYKFCLNLLLICSVKYVLEEMTCTQVIVRFTAKTLDSSLEKLFFVSSIFDHKLIDI